MDLLIWLVSAAALFNPSAQPCQVLTAIDHERERAWAQGDTKLLAGQYVDPHADVAELDRYLARGLTVQGVSHIRADCVDETHAAKVVERLARATAIDPAGNKHLLPAGAWHRRLVKLEFDRRWRIAEIAAWD